MAVKIERQIALENFLQSLRQALRLREVSLADDILVGKENLVAVARDVAYLMVIKLSQEGRFITYRKSDLWIDQIKEVERKLRSIARPGAAFDRVRSILITNEDVSAQIAEVFSMRNIVVLSGELNAALANRVVNIILGLEEEPRPWVPLPGWKPRRLQVEEMEAKFRWIEETLSSLAQYLTCEIGIIQARLDAIEAMVVRDPEERHWALKRWAQRPSPSSVTTLLDRYRDMDRKSRYEIIHGVQKSIPQLRPGQLKLVESTIMDASHDKDPRIRSESVHALSTLALATGDGAGPRQRLKVMTTDSNELVARSAREELEKLQPRIVTGEEGNEFYG